MAMRCFKRKCLPACLFLLSYGLVHAQIRIEHAPREQGTLKRNPKVLTFIRGFKAMPEVKASSLANTADKIMDAVCALPQVSSPTGYNAKVNVAAAALDIKDKQPMLTIYSYFRYLVRDSRYTGIKESMDGADLFLKINAFDIFRQMGNYWEQCSKLHLPLFFEAPALTDSTPDYIEFHYKGGPLRIVTAGSRPLYIPLTRKEFIQFMIAEDELALKDYNEALKTSREGEEQIKKMMASQNESDRAYSAQALKSMDNSMAQGEKNVAGLHEEIGDCRSLLAKMGAGDANAPARLDYNKKGGATAMASLERLVPVGREEGVLLVKMNPAFYQRGPDAPTAQMILVYYAWPTVGFSGEPDYLQQAVLDAFRHLDYHRLKESLQ
jgi:hypothetical protein